MSAFRRSNTGAAVLAAVLSLASCATTDRELGVYDETDREAHTAALAEWCRMVGPCEQGAAGLIPLAPLPAYDESCGYLPPIYGTDC